jgi:hypothetical protein
MAEPLRNNNNPRRHWWQFLGWIGTCVDARLAWISFHSNIRVHTAALEADPLAGLLCGRPRDYAFCPHFEVPPLIWRGRCRLILR